MEDGTARARLQPDAENRFVRLRAELGVTSFGLNQIVLHAGQRGRIHAHERQEEVYLVLEGTLSLFVEGEEATLEPGELIRVAPASSASSSTAGPARCTCSRSAAPASTRAATAGVHRLGRDRLGLTAGDGDAGGPAGVGAARLSAPPTGGGSRARRRLAAGRGWRRRTASSTPSTGRRSPATS